MADHAEHAEPRSTDQSAHYRQYWDVRSEKLGFRTPKRQVIPGTTMVQIKDRPIGFYTDHTCIIVVGGVRAVDEVGVSRV